MNKMKTALISGMDQLNVALLINTLILALLALLMDNDDLKSLCWIPFVFCIYRMISKQHIMRYKENVWFMKRINPIIKPIYIKFVRIKDREHKYYQCPFCNQIIRVEKQKENATISCPICKSEFNK